MFGTVARLQVKPGMEDQLREYMRVYESVKVPGHISTHVYKMDKDPNELYLTVVFDSRESYFANANSPEQDARYREMLDFLTAEPEWHDGDVIYSEVYTGADVSR